VAVTQVTSSQWKTKNGFSVEILKILTIKLNIKIIFIIVLMGLEILLGVLMLILRFLPII